MSPPPPRSTLFPYTTLFRSLRHVAFGRQPVQPRAVGHVVEDGLGEGVRLLEHHAHLAAQRHRSEEHTSELQSRRDLVCRLLLEKKNKEKHQAHDINRHSTQS